MVAAGILTSVSFISEPVVEVAETAVVLLGAVVVLLGAAVVLLRVAVVLLGAVVEDVRRSMSCRPELISQNRHRRLLVWFWHVDGFGYLLLSRLTSKNGGGGGRR